MYACTGIYVIMVMIYVYESYYDIMGFSHGIINYIMHDIQHDIIHDIIDDIKKYDIIHDIICDFKGPTLLGTPEKSQNS